MGEKCVVCGEPQTQGTVNYCSDCKLPCHTKCASRKKNAPCDLCRAAKQAKKQKESSLNESKRATATITTRSSAQRTPGSSGETREGRKSALTSTVKNTRSGASSSLSPALQLKTLSTEKGKLRQPLLNSPLGETLLATHKALSAEGASSAAISNCPGESMEISAPFLNSNNISTETRTCSTAGGSPNTTNCKTGDVTPLTESPVYNNIIHLYIIIPESTLDLFSNTFIRSKSSLRSRSRVTTVDPLSPAAASEEMNKELVTRISALQELVMNQTSQLGELRIDRHLLLEENKLMKEQINSLSVTLSALRDCTNIVNDFTSCASADDELLGTNAVQCRDEGSEMVISCEADCAKIKMPPEDFSVAELNTVLPSLSKSDIKAVKMLPQNSSALGSVTLENTSPGTSENAQKSEIIDGPRSAFSLLVRLSSGELLKVVLYLKIFKNSNSFLLNFLIICYFEPKK